MQQLEAAIQTFANLAWGPWLLALLLGGGCYFLILSRFLPLRFLRHGLAVLLGKYDSKEDPGDISHFQALSSALAGTVGMGNIAGVALAITTGGPGAIFWMWMVALLGMTTKFFTCTLAVMYRGRDSAGQLQGGPMYVIETALGRHFRPLALLFAFAGIFGSLPALQANQLVQTAREMIFLPNGWISPAEVDSFNLLAGICLAALVGVVIFGGLRRISRVAASLVPTMTAIYTGAALYVIASHASLVPACLWLIVSDAFTGNAVAGGVLGTVVTTGVRRGAFSNEAGIGTEAMAHGAARTTEPVREGLVAMLGPVVDTLFICTATALIILLSGIWMDSDSQGVTLTAEAFDATLPFVGRGLLIVCIFFFGFSTMLTYSYYGAKCMGYLLGAHRQHWYNYIVVLLVVGAAVMSLDAAIALIDGAFALMAIPTMVSSLLLAPSVMRAAEDYFARLGRGGPGGKEYAAARF